jgi:hypothetical protein
MPLYFSCVRVIYCGGRGQGERQTLSKGITRLLADFVSCRDQCLFSIQDATNVEPCMCSVISRVSSRCAGHSGRVRCEAIAQLLALHGNKLQPRCRQMAQADCATQSAAGLIHGTPSLMAAAQGKRLLLGSRLCEWRRLQIQRSHYPNRQVRVRVAEVKN